MNKAAILALTSAGIQLAKELRDKWDQEIPIFVSTDNLEEGLQLFPTGKFGTGIQVLFKQFDALICIMATGIVVRSIAGLLEDKRKIQRSSSLMKKADIRSVYYQAILAEVTN